ncbi:uncharacterized protein LOC126597449 [Malus sylvestris]|uniref:uncharacterized protein LOC126597449 n=1 Tax=Malus sylvestris TaxID=3752 RepID=UPI0021ABD63D|nr:uncharacterized protein LOC126597449 [Malus sylvestris]
MISQLALAAVSVVFGALVPLFMALILIKGWSWSWHWSWSWRISWQPRIVYCLRGHEYGATSSEYASHRPRLTANSGSQSCSHPLDHEQECCKLDEDDLKVLVSHINETNGCPPWKLMMEHSTPSLTYQAWYRDPRLGPTQYRTRTVFENASPELLKDFFWDDEFRSSWDNMLKFFQILSVCSQTGTMTVHWIRKLPLLCSDREYVIVRRIWESPSGYYCTTKGTPYPSLPTSKTAIRVDNYYSSWRISSVNGRNAEEQQMASEVLLFHHEDIGLPREIVKIGVRAGMWAMVKRLHAGVQMYSVARANGSTSSCAVMANVTTKVSPSTVELPSSQVTADEICQRETETHSSDHLSKDKW